MFTSALTILSRATSASWDLERQGFLWHVGTKFFSVGGTRWHNSMLPFRKQTPMSAELETGLSKWPITPCQLSASVPVSAQNCVLLPNKLRDIHVLFPAGPTI